MSDRPTPEQEAALTTFITAEIAKTQADIAAGRNPFAPKPADDKSKDTPAGPEPLPLIKAETVAPGESRASEVEAVLDGLLAQGGMTADTVIPPEVLSGGAPATPRQAAAMDAVLAKSVLTGAIAVTPELVSEARYQLEEWKGDPSRQERFARGNRQERAWFTAITAIISQGELKGW